MTGERQYPDSLCLFEKRLCFGHADATGFVHCGDTPPPVGPTEALVRALSLKSSASLERTLPTSQQRANLSLTSSGAWKRLTALFAAEDRPTKRKRSRCQGGAAKRRLHRANACVMSPGPTATGPWAPRPLLRG